MDTIITSIAAFVSTNIDDLFLLSLFFGTKKFRTSQIVTGQFVGITTLIVISLAGSLIGLVIDPRYIGLMGFLPLYLGARGLFQLFTLQTSDGDEGNGHVSATGSGVLTVAGITIANGGDNIGIYIPLFSSMNGSDKGVMVTVFLCMTLVWCLIAKYLTHHPYLAKTISGYGHIVTPLILILLGIYILFESDTFTLIKFF